MRKVILDLATTLDGFIEGPNGEIDWCIMDDDMNFDGFISGIDTIFYGRVSYDGEITSLMKMLLQRNRNSGKPFMQRQNLFFQVRIEPMKMQRLFILIWQKKFRK
jgi:dihydrofolate reductase